MATLLAHPVSPAPELLGLLKPCPLHRLEHLVASSTLWGTGCRTWLWLATVPVKQYRIKLPAVTQAPFRLKHGQPGRLKYLCRNAAHARLQSLDNTLHECAQQLSCHPFLRFLEPAAST